MKDQEIDLSHKLPKEIIEDGAKLIKIKQDGVIKFIITNPSKNYRSFIYVSKHRPHTNDQVESLLNTYRIDLNVFSETQKFSMGLITKRGSNGARDV